MQLSAERTALVLIEFQNDFTTEGGVFHGGVKAVMDSTQMLPNTIELVKQAREAGIQIVHVPIAFTDDYHELTPNPYGILKGVKDAGAFKKGTWGAEIVSDLHPHPEDIVIEGKRGLCGFASTNLDFILRSRGFQNIALAGFLTNCCVESSMRTAYEKGYNVITLTDCCATLSQEEYDNALAKDFPMFSQPMTHQAFLSSVGTEIELAGKAYE
ncbi:cysteine hydrolase [Siphonobacter sp. SORGH_AS_1065]|uniref:cysteine hydrolase n=1 Tax=Siphonobacter sp. SORGH_AS_1065 TaxID=3041795 RepID=UPI00278A2E81|nr:cysteine hydrolase [Siphonobacter sp. SORGH_AS_1065]MDQ1085753.1 nicotinamidase-related amidase [Siphonobacter sp. SORGH_AS_1065]